MMRSGLAEILNLHQGHVETQVCQQTAPLIGQSPDGLLKTRIKLPKRELVERLSWHHTTSGNG